MRGLTKVFVVGRLGSKPEMASSQGGRPFTRLSIATQRARKITDDEGSPGTVTHWHSVFVWGKQGELCVKFLDKGAPVLVEGYLSSYEDVSRAGEKQWKSTIHAEKVEFLPSEAKRVFEPSFDS